MKIRITQDTRLKDLADAFNAEFPYLKLVFFSKPHSAFKASPAKYMILDMEQNIRDIAVMPKVGELELPADTPTWQAEKLMEASFGLYVQVMRKSGNTWLVTSVTDMLTLEQQNAKGRAGENVHFMPDEPVDYREQD